ncbi:MAG: sodium:proton exchanger, partial [Sandaracinaceae bacterium]|nr:sodium:proton exchanger [Sandaracinaceae bacterium]
LVAQSPAVVIALRDEMAARGPMSQTVLSVVVLADLLVITLFAIVSSLAGAVFGGSANMIEIARTLVWELFGSMFVGLGIGLIIALYFKYIRGSGPLFLITMCFLMAEIGSRVDLDPLLIGLSAGMLIRNATRIGDALHQDVEVAGLPVYVVFFSVAGASIHLDVLASVGLVAAAIVLIRGMGLLVGSSIGARLAGADPMTRRYAGFGLLPQAGLAIALAILFTKAFPSFGEEASALVFGVIAINEIVAPVLFRHAIIKSGESGLDAYSDDEPAEADLAESA